MSESPEISWTARNAPWVTIAAVVFAVVVWATPALAHLLNYDRLRVTVDHQVWRIFTGNFVHFTGRELIWNIAVLLPAGIWAERLSPLRARLLWVVAPLVIGVIVHGLVADAAHFAGLSGMAAAAVVFLALLQLRTESTDRWFWRAVIILLVLKIGTEAVLASRLMSTVPDPTRRAEALIHLAGLSAGAVMVGARRKR